MTELVKRAIDVVAVSVAGIILLPLILFIALVVRMRLGRPALFRQIRTGQDGELFVLYKFRSMTDEVGSDGRLLPDEQRLTKFGGWLRSTSLDELPTLWNVLRGDMSLVGPRPLLPEYLELYSAEQARRHKVKPGLTGWAQIHGRNRLSWEEKFRLDVWYVDHRSLALDIKIIFKTIWYVLSREGISHDGHSTAPKFRGS